MARTIQEFIDGRFETRSYSGRGMFGEKCLSVHLDGGTGELVASLVRALRGQDDEAHEIVAKALASMKTDSLGRGMVAYFPGTPYTNDDSDLRSLEEEEDEGCDMERDAFERADERMMRGAR